MTGDAVLAAVKVRLAALALSTRPWILLGPAGPAIAFDDTDTLVPGRKPVTWQAVARTIRTELWRQGLIVGATAHDGETGEVRIAYAPRRPRP